MISGLLSRLLGGSQTDAGDMTPAKNVSHASDGIPPLALGEISAERDIWARYYQRCVVQEREYLAANDRAFVARTDHGCKPLAKEDLTRYVALYGGHHIAKLTSAFGAADLGRHSGATIEIYDWGCGQALASCFLIEFLRELCVRCSLRRVTMIDPSNVALDRGAELLTQTLATKGYIRTICATLGDLKPETVSSVSLEDIKIHLFSNILDIDRVDGWRLAKLITQSCPGRNEFICVSPLYPFSRIEPFARYFSTMINPEAVTNLSRNREPLTGRIFDTRQGDFKEWTITRDEARFTVEIPPRPDEEVKDEISDPFGRERFAVRTSRALRRLFRND